MKPNVIDLVEQAAALDLEDRRDVFGREVQNIKQEAAMRGGLRNSRVMVVIQGAVSRELRVRTHIVWNSIARALTSVKDVPTDSTASDAKELVARLTNEHSADLREHLGFASRLSQRVPLASFDPLLRAALDRINSEINFALLASSSGPSTEGAAVVNIYQSQGIVQTGAHASASMTINIGPEDREEIKSALYAAQEAIERDVTLADVEKRDALELINETTAELQKEEPNRLKLRGGLQGVATTVQVMAAAPQAYGLLKGAAALIGLNLP